MVFKMIETDFSELLELTHGPVVKLLDVGSPNYVRVFYCFKGKLYISIHRAIIFLVVFVSRGDDYYLYQPKTKYEKKVLTV